MRCAVILTSKHRGGAAGDPPVAGEIDQDLIRHVAMLARLKPSPAQVARLADELSAILGYFDQLKELDTTEVPPMSHALPLVNVLREDRVSPSSGVEVVLANAPQRQESFFRVPKVLGQDSA